MSKTFSTTLNRDSDKMTQNEIIRDARKVFVTASDGDSNFEVSITKKEAKKLVDGGRFCVLYDRKYRHAYFSVSHDGEEVELF